MVLGLISVVLIALAILNIRATRAVLQDDLSSQGQRAAQISFVWLIPILGALLTIHLRRKQLDPPSGFYREEPDPGYDFGYICPSQRRIEEPVGAEGSGSADGGPYD